MIHMNRTQGRDVGTRFPQTGPAYSHVIIQSNSVSERMLVSIALSTLGGLVIFPVATFAYDLSILWYVVDFLTVATFICYWLRKKLYSWATQAYWEMAAFTSVLWYFNMQSRVKFLFFVLSTYVLPKNSRAIARD